MATTRKAALAGAAAAVALLAGLGGQGPTAARAQGGDGEHVRWNDDGTVDFLLGPEYDDTVITVRQEDLGSLFGPDQRPFEGAEITVLTLDSGPKGGISGPIHALRPV